MSSSWDRPDGDRQDQAQRRRPEEKDVPRAEPPADDRWLEQGLELRRARRKRLEVTDDDG